MNNTKIVQNTLKMYDIKDIFLFFFIIVTRSVVV